MSGRKAAEVYKIPRKTLDNKFRGLFVKKWGAQTCLSASEEAKILHHILTCAEWGLPLCAIDIRLIVKDYLDRAGKILLNSLTIHPARTGTWAS